MNPSIICRSESFRGLPELSWEHLQQQYIRLKDAGVLWRSGNYFSSSGLVFNRVGSVQKQLEDNLSCLREGESKGKPKLKDVVRSGKAMDYTPLSPFSHIRLSNTICNTVRSVCASTTRKRKGRSVGISSEPLHCHPPHRIPSYRDRMAPNYLELLHNLYCRPYRRVP